MRPVADDPFSDEDEAAIRALLAAEPRPTMPADVAARIEQALRDTATMSGAAPASSPADVPAPQTASPPDAAAPGPRWTRWLPGAVAAAIILVLAAVVMPRLGGSDPAPVVAPPVPETCAPLINASGNRYQQAALHDQAGDLLTPAAYCQDPQSPSVPTGTQPVGYRMAPGTTMAPQMSNRLVQCVVRLADKSRVVVLDRARYEGEPAVVAVVEPPRRALVLDCRAKPRKVLATVALQ